VNVMNRIIASVCLLLALLICGGCGSFLGNSHYVYIPGGNINNGTEPLPVTVVINYLDDLRGKECNENVPLVFIPLVPYAKSHYDRPETESKLMVKNFKPGENFAHALMQEMKQNNLFSEVSLGQQDDRKKADLIVTGRIKKASIDTIVTSYGMSIFGILPWMAGLPEGTVFNELDVEYEMRRSYDNALVWKCDVKGDWSKMFGFYYNYSKDEPYFGMNEILRKGLHNGLALLGDDIKIKPLEYWKR